MAFLPRASNIDSTQFVMLTLGKRFKDKAVKSHFKLTLVTIYCYFIVVIPHLGSVLTQI